MSEETDVPATCRDDIERQEQAAPQDPCNAASRIEESGRMNFRGLDMAFFTINGIQMFTLYEIMRKICPESQKGTIGNRFTRLNAMRHACNKEEIIKVKELGGINKKFMKCSLVARVDVERYCERYAGKTDARTKSGFRGNRRDSKAVIVRKSKPKDIDIVAGEPTSNDGLSLADVSTCSSHKTDMELNTNNNNGPNMDNYNKVKSVTDATIEVSAPVKNIKETVGDINSNTQKKSVELSKSVQGEISEAKTPEEQARVESTGKVSISPSQKRKRRTQFELLQSYEFYEGMNSDNTGKRQKMSASDPDYIPPGRRANMDTVQHKSPENFLWQFDDDNVALDGNNNDVEPRSPTLLLKRSQNKWHVAKAVLPELAESEKELIVSKKQIKSVVPQERKKVCNATKKGRKTKHQESVRPLTLIKNPGKKGGRKVKKSNKKKIYATILQTEVIEHDKISHSHTDHISDILENPHDSTVQPESQCKKWEGRQGLFLKNNMDGKFPGENKRDVSHEVVKKKRKRRTEENAFRLIETIPYPSLLVVRDGDLFPSYSMTYNKKNDLPGCGHPLWRWQLGRPVRIPTQKSPVETNQPVQPTDQAQNNDTNANNERPPTNQANSKGIEPNQERQSTDLAQNGTEANPEGHPGNQVENHDAKNSPEEQGKDRAPSEHTEENQEKDPRSQPQNNDTEANQEGSPTDQARSKGGEANQKTPTDEAQNNDANENQERQPEGQVQDSNTNTSPEGQLKNHALSEHTEVNQENDPASQPQKNDTEENEERNQDSHLTDQAQSNHADINNEEHTSHQAQNNKEASQVEHPTDQPQSNDSEAIVKLTSDYLREKELSLDLS